eukprot:1367644-Rhodomonas_salina.1
MMRIVLPGIEQTSLLHAHSRVARPLSSSDPLCSGAHKLLLLTLQTQLQETAFLVQFLLKMRRLSPVFPFAMLGYALGATSVGRLLLPPLVAP